MIAQAGRAGLGFLAAFGVTTGHVSLILIVVFAFVLNTGEVLYDIALHSYLPALVPEATLQWANSRLVTAETVVFEFAGPASGGFLFARVASFPFFTDAAMFLSSAGVVWTLGRRSRIFLEEPQIAPGPAGKARSGPSSRTACDGSGHISWCAR